MFLPTGTPSFTHLLWPTTFCISGTQTSLHRWTTASFPPPQWTLISPFRMSALGRQLTNLIYGTYVQPISGMLWAAVGKRGAIVLTAMTKCLKQVLTPIMPSDNYNLVNAGRKGNLYQYDGTFFKWLKGYRATGRTEMKHWFIRTRSENLRRFAATGTFNVAGAPTECGIYSSGITLRNIRAFYLLISYFHRQYGKVEIGTIFFWAKRCIARGKIARSELRLTGLM